MSRLKLHYFQGALAIFFLTILVPVASRAADSAPSAQKVYDLLASGKPEEALETLNLLALREPLPWELKAQKAYILLQLNRDQEAAGWLKSFRPDPLQRSQVDQYALLHAIVAEHLHNYREAYAGYHALENSPDTEVAQEARGQLAYLPDVAREDKWVWGAIDGEGTYYGRYGMVAGEGEASLGTFIPGARWIRPFAAFTYIGDTRSSSSGSPQGFSELYSQNLAGVKGGLTAQPFADLDINVYVEGGEDKDLIDSPQHRGKWFADIQGGINGYGAWGPGAVLKDGTGIKFTLDWFAEFGGDFSYYSRIPDTIAYLQSHEGLRIIEFGQLGALDIYAAENGAFDLRGSYFENYGEIGPEARLIFQPLGGMTISLDAGYYNGEYMGRNDLDDRGGYHSTYNEMRATLALSYHW